MKKNLITIISVMLESYEIMEVLNIEMYGCQHITIYLFF